MNKTELQAYFSSCLERHSSRYYAVEAGENWQTNYWRHIALGHAKLLIAKRGPGATLLKREADAINPEWESDALAGEIQAAIGYVADQKFEVDVYLSGGVQAAIQFDREPTEADAEQASACCLLAEAASHFRTAKGYGVDEPRIETLIGQCVDPISVPAPQSSADPLRNAIFAALTHLGETRDSLCCASGGQDSDLALFDGFIHPPSAWAHHLADRSTRNLDMDASLQIEQLIVAYQELPEQIMIARQDRRDKLNAAFGTKPSLPESAFWTEPAEYAAPTIESGMKIVSPGPAREMSPPASFATAGQTLLGQTFLAIGENLIAKKGQDWSWDEKTVRQARALYTLFSRFLAEEHGVTTFALLRQPHLYAYDQFMRVLHTHYGKSPADNMRSIAQLREISKHKPAGQRGLAVPTRNRHLTQLSALLNEAATIGEHLDPGLSLSKLRGKKVGRARNERAVPSEAQVNAFFQSPIFMGCYNWKKPHISGDHVFHRAAFFGPILAYYQGMRREEYCGLAVTDVIVDNGLHPYLNIVKNEFRRLKTPQSERNLALHSELIRLGFLDYVAAIARAGHSRLFPDLYSPGSSSPLGDKLFKELEPLGRLLGISPHQFRHIFNDELKQQRVAQEYRADMLGHGGDSETTERYCNPASIALQIEDLHKLPVRTGHIQSKAIQLLPWVLKGDVAPWSRSKKEKMPV
ncbi:tyrosine-type recombinase/integrase [Devosia psychrophila]|uniref:Phage integrase family protein n=1 Tax=Devosia psychrophila TaxID=728005 RepID=A0A0F5PYR1_9HYPH|nr:tyrosine-type recombinase/integrase [Devosia psychrophila]KKC32964.1 hypothetical protein WH91_11235 [Devosia psychrophila]SFD05447.1 Phage integrase family protein [Devosia psychrophila]